MHHNDELSALLWRARQHAPLRTFTARVYAAGILFLDRWGERSHSLIPRNSDIETHSTLLNGSIPDQNQTQKKKIMYANIGGYFLGLSV